MIKLVIVDDHTLFSEGLASILRMQPDIEVSGLAESVKEAIEVIDQCNPDIVLMDFSLPDGTGAEATRMILEKHREQKIIILTMSEDEENLIAAIRAGARGYLLKNLSPSKLVVTIRSVNSGESALSRTMTLRLMEELSRTKESDQIADISLRDLTDRELDVLREIVKGSSNKEIASQLFISQNTVKYHVHSILEKLNLPDRNAAAKFAKDHGIKD